eukprot:TRINITY_DN9344_c0_g1_i1.p1 TRINITY_DN9344_c0_g1~~TRINITY_DN9344_c0_g1_i1.p1  ORF type:complete len:343 (-),score=107.14 TRINITY_DN9344_c0_g1_i1:25-1029(-)
MQASRRISAIAAHINPSKSTNPVSNSAAPPTLFSSFPFSSYSEIHANPTSSEAPVINQAKLLDQQVAIITGSGQGIGLQTAILFAQHGAKVVVTDIDAEKSNSAAKRIQQEGGEALSIPGDVTDPEFPEKIIKKTIEVYGKLNHLVNNAGYTWDGMLHKMTDKQWEAILNVHNTAPFRLIRAAAPFMRELAKVEIEKYGKPQQFRSIVNVSSTSGLHGNVGQANYATAKMGIVGLTKTVAKEWGPFGIRCNAVAFGAVDTRLTQDRKNGEFIEIGTQKVALGVPQDTGIKKESSIPLRRIGTPSEAAGSILMLCTPYAEYITGHCLEVTGGAGI